jgi:YD repeat-containing protein
MTAMYTYRGTGTIDEFADFGPLLSAFDKTTWQYDEATGLLTNKVYADGKATAYSYTGDGKLAISVCRELPHSPY